MSRPILRNMKFDRDFILTTDTSDESVGFTL